MNRRQFILSSLGVATAALLPKAAMAKPSIKSSRPHLTSQELVVWQLLEDMQKTDPFQFHAQELVGECICDFAIPAYKINIEIDCHNWPAKTEFDLSRYDHYAEACYLHDKKMRVMGWKIVRLSEVDTVKEMRDRIRGAMQYVPRFAGRIDVCPVCGSEDVDFDPTETYGECQNCGLDGPPVRWKITRTEDLVVVDFPF